MPHRRPLGLRCATSATLRGRTTFDRGFAADDRDGRLDGLLDIAQLTDFARRTEGHGAAIATGARGAADPVDIVFGHVRQVVVIDMRDFRDVQTTRSHIGRDQHLRLALAERS